MFADDIDPCTIELTFSWPTSSPRYSTINGTPYPSRAYRSRFRILTRALIEKVPCGWLASHLRNHPRLSSNTRSSCRESRNRIGRRVTSPSRIADITGGSTVNVIRVVRQTQPTKTEGLGRGLDDQPPAE